MGWPLAVSAGLMERSSRALIAALWPLAVGHLLAMLVVLLPFAFLAALVEWQRQIRIGASLLVIAFGIFLLVNPRHPRALARIPPTQLGLWSFAVAIAHGAGFMLVPIYLGLCRAADVDSGHEAAGALINGNLGMAVLVSLVHGAAMIASWRNLCMVSLPLPRSQIRVAELVQSRRHLGRSASSWWARSHSRSAFRASTDRAGPTEPRLGLRTRQKASAQQSSPIMHPLSPSRSRIRIEGDTRKPRVRLWPMTSDSALRRYFRTWGLSRHCADCREMCGCNLVAPRLIGGGPHTSSGSLAMLAAMRGPRRG